MHLIDHIIFYNFYLLVRKVYQLIKFITQSYVFIAFEFIFIHIYCLSKKPQKASDGLLQAIWSHLFTASSFFPHFSRRPGFSGSRFFRVPVFPGPGFSGSRFFRVQVFQGLGPVLEVALPIFSSVQIKKLKFISYIYFFKNKHLFYKELILTVWQGTFSF